MGVPKRKRSRPRRDKRFANKGIQVKAITTCKNCKEAVTPHALCKHCGFYKGVKLIITKPERELTRGKIREQKKLKTQQHATPTNPE